MQDYRYLSGITSIFFTGHITIFITSSVQNPICRAANNRISLRLRKHLSVSAWNKQVFSVSIVFPALVSSRTLIRRACEFRRLQPGNSPWSWYSIVQRCSRAPPKLDTTLEWTKIRSLHFEKQRILKIKFNRFLKVEVLSFLLPGFAVS